MFEIFSRITNKGVTYNNYNKILNTNKNTIKVINTDSKRVFTRKGEQIRTKYSLN